MLFRGILMLTLRLTMCRFLCIGNSKRSSIFGWLEKKAYTSRDLLYEFIFHFDSWTTQDTEKKRGFCVAIFRYFPCVMG